MHGKETIREVKGYTGVGYEKYINGVKIQEVFVKGFIKKSGNGTYFLLVDTYGHLIDEVFNFLNSDEDNCWGKFSHKMRELAFNALKLLYSFKELNNLSKIEDINKVSYAGLNCFLSGGTYKGNNIDLELKTKRKNCTFNNYCFVYRAFFKYIGFLNNIFNEKKSVRILKASGEGFLAHTKTRTSDKFTTTKAVPKMEVVPKYIKFDEYSNMIHLLRERQDEALNNDDQRSYVIALRAELIIHLMYTYGMRIGEVLGLTLEDIEDMKITGTGNGKLIIRNRHTDKPFQFAKGCMKINSENDYNLDGYYQSGVGKAFGCDTIDIFEETLELIEDYKNASRKFDFLGSKARKNLRENNIATKVTTRKDIKENKYLFISSHGTPLDRKTWELYLQDIFRELSIPLDKDTRKNNLNHRFRHGFAMYKKTFEKHDILQLKWDLRHSSITSCEIYFNPTQEESGKIANEADKFLNESGVTI